MIHSLAGGKMSQLDFFNFAKIKITEGNNQGQIFWYIFDNIELNINDYVIVPLGKNNIPTRGIVLKIELNKSNQLAPIPTKTAKYIINKIQKE